MKKLQILACAFVVLLSFTQAKAQINTSKDAVLTAYYGVKNALINSNAATANAKAKEFQSAVSALTADQLAEAQKDKLLFDARHIGESNDIAHQREHFAKLSENMYALVKAGKFNSAPVYRDYCPMKKSYWLSESAAIKNPYYGNQMLTCGEVKETLPAAQ
ncbi:DUF3347 domain-containing protein [Mucilaginibacter sp. KACC 22063]|uniref:DUF3347 domain-containing protein n=1 Tax=Mucilaginibacter sp. KACC 22063 TaxID=3025666 RepID=UPI002365B9FE|nr:DUF3347 domain-containing protein [Mucilaginibacter sp. KACC 22063]WDF55603.1 DUF3347 domain-containing protein [Mucilaginibacter sp. KACC 22063]